MLQNGSHLPLLQPIEFVEKKKGGAWVWTQTTDWRINPRSPETKSHRTPTVKLRVEIKLDGFQTSSAPGHVSPSCLTSPAGWCVAAWLLYCILSSQATRPVVPNVRLFQFAFLLEQTNVYGSDFVTVETSLSDQAPNSCQITIQVECIQ